MGVLRRYYDKREGYVKRSCKKGFVLRIMGELGIWFGKNRGLRLCYGKLVGVKKAPSVYDSAFVFVLQRLYLPLDIMSNVWKIFGIGVVEV